MPLPTPTFDSRTYRELLNETLARVPAHNPEWNNLNDSDPGVTLLQLFAFMTENLIYRTNLIPERNRQKYLQLLGVPMRPAEPAHGMVTFQNPKGPLEVITVREEEELLAGNVPFRTENALDVLPIETRLYYKFSVSGDHETEIKNLYSKLYASYDTELQDVDFYETKIFESPDTGVVLLSFDLAKTRDQSLWVALLARSKKELGNVRRVIGSKVLSLGIVPALDETGCTLYPLGSAPSEERPQLAFEIPNIKDARIRYKPLRTRMDTDPLVTPSVVQLTLPPAAEIGYWEEGPLTVGVGNRPPSIEESDDRDRLITWIRIRAAHTQIDLIKEESTAGTVSVPLSWVGSNSVRIVQRTRVMAEQLPIGTGEPDQVMSLINSPVIPPSLKLTINGEQWKEIDDLHTAPPEVPPHSPRFASDVLNPLAAEREENQVFSLDPESGEIGFGDGAHGKRPPKGAAIQASYVYGGGHRGVVGIGSITKGQMLPPGIKVVNPVPTWGGSEGESVAEAERNIPKFIRHRDRLVSTEDFEEITLRTPGVDLGRVEVLPLFHPNLKRQEPKGVVTVLVIPKTDPEQPEAPRPDQLFLETICTYLAPRRILTTEVHVRGPQYKDLWLSAAIDITPGADEPVVREQVEDVIEYFLSPLTGGFEQQGWPLNKTVDAQEVLAAVARAKGVAKVNQLRLASAGSDVPEISIEDLELPHVKKVMVVVGDIAPEIEAVRGEVGEAGTPEAEGPVVIPVPFVPKEC